MKKVKKHKGKRFAPVFTPVYVDVIAVGEEGLLYKLQMDRRAIEYDGGYMRIYVVKP